MLRDLSTAFNLGHGRGGPCSGHSAGAYRLLGALQDNKSGMLYSMNAMTSYGQESLHLTPHWGNEGSPGSVKTAGFCLLSRQPLFSR
jgi:hypothetical protein